MVETGMDQGQNLLGFPVAMGQDKAARRCWSLSYWLIMAVWFAVGSIY